MKFGNPVASVVDKELAYFVRSRPIKIYCRSPIIFITSGEIVFAVDREIIAVWTEMVVHDVENDPQTVAVGGIDKALECLCIAIVVGWGIKIYAIIPPVPAARKLGDRHDLYQGNSQTFKFREFLYSGVK